MFCKMRQTRFRSLSVSIRLIAKDLYRCMREVELLERRVQNASPGERSALMDRLRKLNAEREELRRILEGSKETDFPKKYR